MKRGKTKRHVAKKGFTRLSSQNLLKLAAFGTASLALPSGLLAETAVSFGSFTTDNIEIGTIPNYGDNVSASSDDYTVAPGLTGIVGTPNVTMDWVTGWHTYTAWDGRGNVAQTDFNSGNPLSLVLTPAVNTAVVLESFYLDLWSGGGPAEVSWSVEGSIRGTISSGNWTMSDSGRTLVSPNVTSLLGESLTLYFTRVMGAPSYIALDNLVLDQVPEPSILALGGLAVVALGAAAMRRRKRA